MDDPSSSLEALSNLLTLLTDAPYDLALHARHIRLADVTDADQALAAREMMSAFWPAGNEVWLPLINSKKQTVNTESAEGSLEVLAMYETAEDDYLSIELLKSHIEFLVERYEHFASQDMQQDGLEGMFNAAWTRAAISSVVDKGAAHLSKSHILWDTMRDWVLESIENSSEGDKQEWIPFLESIHITRLQQPHANHDATFQTFSSFVSNHKPPQEYESLLVSASKMRAKAVKNYERRERLENALNASKDSLASFADYITYERRARTIDLAVCSTVYERAIAEGAQRRFEGEDGAETTLRAFWSGYADVMRMAASDDLRAQLAVLKRAVRSVPGSGAVWARYLRLLERISTEQSDEAQKVDGDETVADAYTRALAIGLVQKDVEELVPLVFARAGYEVRKIQSGTADDDTPGILVRVLEDGIEIVKKASPMGDGRFRLQKYLADFYLTVLEMPEAAIGVWQSATKQFKTSYVAWTAYADLLVKEGRLSEARAALSDMTGKNCDWPEALWEAWLGFEHIHGSLADIEACEEKIERARAQVNAKRAKESYQAMQIAMEQQAASVPVADVHLTRDQQAADMDAMDVDAVPREAGAKGKRKAEEEPASAGSKKPKIETTSVVQLKRDRENCTVFVAQLPVNTAEDDLKALFKDCGHIREIKITSLPNALVATVEFTERDSVPAALTKDKKRVEGYEVAVHIAWQSTLYVTNFAESMDDKSMRDMFGKYGTIFDIRWPSKKFKSTRRFCYVQYTSPDAAKAALELHGRELEPGLPLNVFLSNPERRKERSDANADSREVYVAGLSKFAKKEDLEKLFKTYGALKEVRMALETDGKCKGFAFVEFEEEKDALAALAANNHELKNRRMAVTLADSRVKARHRAEGPSSGLGKKADVQNRSIRIRGIPAGTQEGLLQQELAKHMQVKRVEVFTELNEAVVELESAAEAGRLLLLTEPIVFNGVPHEAFRGRQWGKNDNQTREERSHAICSPHSTVAPEGGIGHTRKAAAPAQGGSAGQDKGQDKGQDDFRKMLGL